MTLINDGTVLGDGSWLLTIHITDMKRTVQLRVHGDTHIGGLMLRLVEHVDITRDWSDHAIWWPQKRRWLTHTRSTLDQVAVTSETQLEFTPMHKVARVQLPDLQMIDARLDYSVPVFNCVVQLCKELGIRYPEELSLKRSIHPDRLKRGEGFEEDEILAGAPVPLPGTLKRQTPISASHGNLAQRPEQLNVGENGQTPYGTMTRQMTPSIGAQGTLTTSPMRGVSPGFNENYGPRARSPMPTGTYIWGDPLSDRQFDPQLINSPQVHVRNAAQAGLFRPKDYEQKAAINRGWLDSSRSLMEQGVFEGQTVLLRFKFCSFFDLNPKIDQVRVNQLFEQAKWQVLFEELDSTDDEAMMFAALHLQAQLAANQQEPEEDKNKAADVELLLDELENTLEVTATQRRVNDLTEVPSLEEYLKYMKPKRMTLKSWKRGFFRFRDLYLSYYNTAQEAHGPPLGRICLKGCEVSQDVNIQTGKYVIKLLVPSAEGMSEFYMRCETEGQYVRWMAACRMASRGKTMADAGYNGEVESLRRLLQMQHGGAAVSSVQPTGSRVAPTHLPQSFEPDEYVPQRVAKKRTRQQLNQRISEAHANVRNLSATDAKMQYIRAWQALPENGMHYFIVRFRNARKNELLAVCYNRIMRMDVATGESLKTWRYSNMKRWHVNWEIKHVLCQMEDENVEFKPVSADCKVVHEFIGGYIFCTMRSKEHSTTLDQEMFHRLTGGWTGNTGANVFPQWYTYK